LFYGSSPFFTLDPNVNVRYKYLMDDKLNTYYIGEISKLLDLSQRTIRYYEELGFIHPKRTDGGFRTYSRRDVDVIRMVLNFKDLGMSLDEIHLLFSLGNDDAACDSLKQLHGVLYSKRAEFETKITKYKEGIEHIDRVLQVLSTCTTCGQSCGRDLCEECLKGRGEKSSALIENFLPDVGSRSKPA
jgi:DNA-binding transcriptional MerR regulator